MKNWALRFGILFVVLIPIHRFSLAGETQSCPGLTSEIVQPEAINRAVHEIRSVNFFRNRRHLPIFELPIQRLVRRLELRRAEYPTESAAAAVITSLLAEAGQRLKSHRITYQWGHIFAARSVLILNEPVLPENDFGSLRDHDKFADYFNFRADPPSWLAKKLIKFLFLPELLGQFPKIFLMLSVDDELGQGARWPVSFFNEVEGYGVYPLAIPQSEGFVAGSSLSILEAYFYDTVLVQKSKREIYDKWVEDPALLAIWRQIVAQMNQRISLIEDPMLQVSANYVLYFMYREDDYPVELVRQVATGKLDRDERMKSLLHKMSYRLHDPKDENGQLPPALRSSSREEIEEFIRPALELFRSVVMQLIENKDN